MDIKVLAKLPFSPKWISTVRNSLKKHFHLTTTPAIRKGSNSLKAKALNKTSFLLVEIIEGTSSRTQRPFFTCRAKRLKVLSPSVKASSAF